MPSITNAAAVSTSGIAKNAHQQADRSLQRPRLNGAPTYHFLDTSRTAINGTAGGESNHPASSAMRNKNEYSDAESLPPTMSLGIQMQNLSTEQFVGALESYLRINDRSVIRSNVAELLSSTDGLAIPHLATASSIAAALGSLDMNQMYHIAEFACKDFTRTVGSMLQFYRSTCIVHDAYETGLADIIRMQLARKVPDYSTKGYLALTEGNVVRTPRIYISDMSMWKHTFRHLCQEVGLPESSVEIIPSAKGRMNTFALQAIIERDERSNNIPLVIVAVAGNNETGASDPLPKCMDIGRRYNVWLHAEGMGIPMLCLLPPPQSAGIVTKIADSITVDFEHWLGKFGLSKVTFLDATKDASVSEHMDNRNLQRHAQRIRLLPLWALLCLEGSNFLYKRSRSILELSFKLQKCILAIKTCVLLSPVKFAALPSTAGVPAIAATATAQGATAAASGGNNAVLPGSVTFDDVLAKASTGNVLLELLNPLVVFRFQVPPMEEREELIDALNVWLCTMLNREGVIPFDASSLPTHGICLHFSPYESLRSQAHYSNADIDLFVDRLTNFVSILQYTFVNRSYFRKLIEDNDSGCMQYVPVPYWPGLGAVRYIPKLWRSVACSQAGRADHNESGGGDDLNNNNNNSADGGGVPETAWPELNKFNQFLLDQLKARDTAYSKGEDAATGLLFIRFGMVDETTRIEDLVVNVRREGVKLEESREFHDSVAELVRKGIAAAQQDLKRESEDKLREEGLLRQVPVFGSFVNWWYPSPKAGNINGRSFNLAAGTMEKIQFISATSIIGAANSTVNSSGVHEHLTVSRQASKIPDQSGAKHGRDSRSSSVVFEANENLAAAAAQKKGNETNSSESSVGDSPVPQTMPGDADVELERRSNSLKWSASVDERSNEKSTSSTELKKNISRNAYGGGATVQWPGSAKLSVGK